MDYFLQVHLHDYIFTYIYIHLILKINYFQHSHLYAFFCNSLKKKKMAKDVMIIYIRILFITGMSNNNHDYHNIFWYLNH